MTNDIKIITNKYQVNQHFIDAQVAYLNGDKEKAKEELQKSFYQDLALIHLSTNIYSETSKECYNLRNRYQDGFEKLQLEMPSLNKCADQNEYL